MRDVPMPRDLSEEAVAEWLRSIYEAEGMFTFYTGDPARRAQARAVRALVSAKVREAADLACHSPYSNTRSIVDHVVSRVLGEEAPRG